MPQYRVAKQKPPSRFQSSSERFQQLIQAISSKKRNIDMVACTPCAQAGAVCYYDREQSTKCARCIEKRGTGVVCDGTFSLEEFRKIGEQKKLIKQQSLTKRREIAQLMANLARLQSEENDLSLEYDKLKEISNNMIKREMQALGVMESLGDDQGVVGFDPGVVSAGAPIVEFVDWNQVFDVEGVSSSTS